MTIEVTLITLVALAILVVAGLVIWRQGRSRERRDRARLDAARELGLHLPASIHPVFDPDICIGSLACVSACPEGDVIGIVKGVGTLLVGANCIGHGRCAAECPVGAIQLVFGTSERGVDIPRVSPDFESTVPGIYIAGELGGMGLVRNAIRQGAAVIRHIAGQLPPDRDRDENTPVDDVIVIGAGPAGFAAGLAAMEKGLRFRIIEQDTFGGTVAHYPRQKLVMSEAIELPMAGRISRGSLAKEDLLKSWIEVRQRFNLPIQEGERVDDIQKIDDGFRVVTNRGSYETRKVVLAIGRRGTPRRLGVPGEELPIVTYRLIEPEQYVGHTVLVVGGGDSAVEAACTLADAGAEVSLCHRRLAFDRCKPANRDRIERLEAARQLNLLLGKAPIQFGPCYAVLAPAGGDGASLDGPQQLPADFVIICTGGEMPTSLLNRVGIQVDKHYGEPDEWGAA
jgi:thioredoxin reductase/NAD-dependent dihydropyrimidine dehydrogenase PreA subunit